MKKLMNSPQTLLADALRGVAAAHGQLSVDFENRIVFSTEPREGRVALVSGGGSGHEPLHSGFVGPGMLDAACAGEIFTSPTPDQILAAATRVNTGAGVLFVVKNYTGDLLNFEMAAELAREQGIDVASVVVADDVAVEDSTWTAGRRGVGTTLILEKVAGAAAARGWSLEKVHALAKRIADAGRSMGAALTSCIVPAVGKPSFDLPEDEMELGVGIHGEPGRKRVPMMSAAELSHAFVESITTDYDFSGKPVIALLTGLGGTPLIELYAMFAEVSDRLNELNITIARSLVGNYVTSLDMRGCSLTLVGADNEILDLWDAPVNTPALRWND
ncbi:dihydroxyacetone kinase subunit DhaK [Arthrobacter sp. SRS-W-1-2016]|uniref:dihydroxyacetone kinase subunit DhaK n=1 Tax=Arthrobacter sp. SRS-W-1-2016 TaxID=1930254 RepID=UPI000990F045|nr:dihydroxyacetone kinase subunit DhaK [Arthrobacter sp. SRS-W-1-2016]OOP61447.1 dihydroxyacetone kinase subunit DhaK [Arthrobacter sp. SRS-W-1-2016]